MENQPTAPVMDVTAPPNVDKAPIVENTPPAKEEPKADIKDDKKPEKQKAVTQQKASSPSSNVGLAIIATVVIVFGLAAIATYAFLQQNQ